MTAKVIVMIVTLFIDGDVLARNVIPVPQGAAYCEQVSKPTAIEVIKNSVWAKMTPEGWYTVDCKEMDNGNPKGS